MQRLLSRHFGLVKLLGIGLVVAFASSAATNLVASKLLLDVESGVAAADEDREDQEEAEGEDEKAAASKARSNRASGLADKGTHKASTAEAIVGRNIFCPTCVPADEQPVLANTQPGFVGEVASSLPLQLLATMESDDPTWSMATIRDLDSNSLGPYTANEQVRPGVTILSVERGRVVLLNQGQREYISLGAEPPPPAAKPKPAAAKPKAKPKAKGSSVAIEGAEDAINCANENDCTVDRRFVEKLLKDPRQLMTQARMYPVSKDGENSGFRVARVRKGSLATMLGLENGDVLTEINGAKLGNLDEALAVYQKLRRANHLSVTLQRGGAIITKEISIK